VVEFRGDPDSPRGAARDHRDMKITERSALKLESDETLAQRAAAGNALAFGVLCERHRRAVEQCCLAICRNSHDAADATQEAFLDAYRGIAGYRADRPFRPWLLAIARNATLDLLRTRARQRTAHDSAERLETVAVAFPEWRLDLKAALAAVKSLTAHRRRGLLLRALHGLSYAEIGTHLGTTENAARQLVFQARADMRRNLAFAA
jgi:RNA polymerase sigma-70 factor, ECF subfamily